MGRAKRIERVVALTKLLADHPYRLFSFSYFCKNLILPNQLSVKTFGQ